MDRKTVVSTNIASIGYEDSILEVQFLDGTIYQYYDVPISHYNYMINYPHPGTYLARNIKGRFQYRRMH